jgi:UDP-N-acetylglucosamine acyltransferase
LGGFTVVHQFVRIGAHAMTAMCSLLFADVPPYVMCQGQPAGARSMNFEGLRRRGFGPERISAVKAMHKALYRDGLTLAQSCEAIEALKTRIPESAADVDQMLAFLNQSASSQRGIVR